MVVRDYSGIIRFLPGGSRVGSDATGLCASSTVCRLRSIRQTAVIASYALRYDRYDLLQLAFLFSSRSCRSSRSWSIA